MRQVLGDSSMHYFGISYGTELGGVYAHLFPRNVGRLVLDAVVDPSADTWATPRTRRWASSAPWTTTSQSTGQDPRAGLAEDRRPAGADRREAAADLGARKLTQTLALTGIVLPLYSETGLAAPDQRAGGGREGGRFGNSAGRSPTATTNVTRRATTARRRIRNGSYRAWTTSSGRRPEETRKLLPEFERISPVFGHFLGWDTAGWCHDWPVAGQHDTPEVSAPGADPVLVVGNTGDPATPYEGARKMADELGKGVGVVLTWKGEGHGAYGSGSDCVDSTVNGYLLDGTVPKDGKVCS